MCNNARLFEANDLTCTFGHGNKSVVAVNKVTFDIKDEEIVTFVGESGSGKTTLARMLLNLQKQSSGHLTFLGEPITNTLAHWRKVQGVFQDPFTSFNQFYTVQDQLMDCFRLFSKRPEKEEMHRAIHGALEQLNIDADEVKGKYPFELSGGQMQRLMIARIFIIQPKVLVADEPTSMVDACSRAGILESLLELKQRLKMTIVFITHDLGLADYVSDRIFVMHKGEIVESGNTKEIIFNASHEYTKKLLSSIPTLDGGWLNS